MAEISEIRKPPAFVILKVRLFRKDHNFLYTSQISFGKWRVQSPWRQTHTIFKRIGKIRAVVVLGCEFGY